MGLFRNPNAEYRADPQMGIGDPALADFLGVSASSLSGVSVTETSALGLSAVWRCVSLIAGTIAGLPLKTYRREGDTKVRVKSFLDQPHPDMTQYEWVETLLAQELLWGNGYLFHIYGGAGQVIGLAPIHPSVVVTRLDPIMGKIFKVRQADGSVREYTSVDITHIPGLGYDGVAGLSPISVARNSLGVAMAGERAAAKLYRNGLMLGGVITSKETLTKTQGDKLLAGLQAKSGADHAGDIAFIPAAVEFNPWTMSADDAQFTESRHYSIEEIGRWYGVPRELLNESGASSWGSGIQELVRAFARFTLASWTTRIEQRLSRLLPDSQFVEFDYSSFLQPSPEIEINLLLQQVAAGLITVNEARAIRNMPPLPTAATSEVSP